MSKIKLIMILFLFHGVCDAATFYVRTDGNNSTCNGSADASAASAPNCAKQTVQAGVDLAYAGGTVIVHTGNYSSANPTFTTVRAGTSGNPIIIKAADGETVTVSRFNLNHEHTKGHGFKVVSSGGWLRPGVAINASNVIVSNNTIKGTGETYGIQTLNAHNNLTITGNILEGSKTLATSFHVGMYLSGSNITISNNIIRYFDSIERAWELYGDGILVSNNECHDWIQTDGGIAHPDIFQLVSFVKSTNVIVENNYFHDIVAQIGNLLNGDPNPPWNQSHTNVWTFRNNIFANISNPVNTDITTYWYNNLFYHCLSYHANIFNTVGASWARNYVYNNAFIGCGYLAVGPPDGQDVGMIGSATSSDYNFVSTLSGGSKRGFAGKEPHGVNGGTLGFIAPYTNCLTNTCNFQLDATSSMIDKGKAISGFSKDFRGVSRPIGAAWAIGPHEGLGLSDTVESPTGLRIQ